MNWIPPIQKPTLFDAISSIDFDYQYATSTDSFGNCQWLYSQDYEPAYLHFMQAAETFAEAVSKTNDLPFVFNKNLVSGVSLKKTNKLGDLFYSMLKQQQAIIAAPNEFWPSSSFTNIYPRLRIPASSYTKNRYEFSENVKLIFNVAIGINFDCVNFTFNPMSMIPETQELREGELINRVELTSLYFS